MLDLLMHSRGNTRHDIFANGAIETHNIFEHIFDYLILRHIKFGCVFFYVCFVFAKDAGVNSLSWGFVSDPSGHMGNLPRLRKQGLDRMVVVRAS